ncbi:MAG: hypothetical protein IKL53_03130 [Lachnospiraceae bacterium]|nr:hypothetical protein [Lachnospiraceae bacterium]
MKSIAFPNMFETAQTRLVEDNAATLQNIHYLLATCRRELFGDPYFGTNLKRYLYEQNSILLRDVIMDELYVALVTFIPQVAVDRKNIKIEVRNKVDVYATVSCINKIDGMPNMFEIKLTED